MLANIHKQNKLAGKCDLEEYVQQHTNYPISVIFIIEFLGGMRLQDYVTEVACYRIPGS